MGKHQKHASIVRRKNGIHSVNEVALLGVKCSVIESLVSLIASNFIEYNLAYFDASHAKDIEKNQLSKFTFHHDGNLEINCVSPLNKYVQRLQFAQYDMVFVNGNHYEALSQIVFLDPEKETSINKRIHQIKEVLFFISTTKDIQPFDSLKEKFPDWKEIPVYSINDTKSIFSHLSVILKNTVPKLKGLVLTGGKSSRMGKDKAYLDYHGKPQKEYVKEVLNSQDIEVYYSVGYTAESSVNSGSMQYLANEIPDEFLGMGPFGGICSAFKKDPNSAWFVIATDVPFVDHKLIQFIIENRDSSKVATTVKGKGKQFPEPLITIYEPKAYPLLLQYLSQGYVCPRKMIINSDVKVLEIEDALIRNINTPDEFEMAKSELKK